MEGIPRRGQNKNYSEEEMKVLSAQRRGYLSGMSKRGEMEKDEKSGEWKMTSSKSGEVLFDRIDQEMEKEERERRERIKENMDERVDGPKDSSCALFGCTAGRDHHFTAKSRNMLSFDGRIFEHRAGPLKGDPLRTGQYVVDRKNKKVVGPICLKDMRILRDNGVIFYDKAGATRIIDVLKKNGVDRTDFPY